MILNKKILNKNAFTIIELLVALAIIGLLTSVIIIATQNVREKARIAKTLQYAGSLYRSMSDAAVGVWNFDEGSGSTVKDASGNGNNGTIFGAVYTDDTPHKVVGAGKGKYALSFDGVNDYVQVPHIADYNFTTQLSIEAWIYADSSNGDIIYKAYDVVIPYELYLSANKLGFFAMGTGFADWSVKSTGSINPGKWNHIVVTFNKPNLHFYINGADDGLQNFNHTLPVTSAPLYFGYPASVNVYYDGLLDEVRLYSRALTAFEVQKLYAEGLGKHQVAEK